MTRASLFLNQPFLQLIIDSSSKRHGVDKPNISFRRSLRICPRYHQIRVYTALFFIFSNLEQRNHLAVSLHTLIDVIKFDLFLYRLPWYFRLQRRGLRMRKMSRNCTQDANALNFVR